MNKLDWRQPFQYFGLAIFFVGLVWLVVTLRPVLSSLMIAALLAYILHPLVLQITRRTPLGHTFAVSIVYVLFLLLLLAIPAILGPFLVGQAIDVVPDFSHIQSLIDQVTASNLVIGQFEIPISSFFENLLSSAAQTAGNLTQNLGNLLSNVSTNFLYVLIVLVLVFYLLKDGSELINWGVNLVTPTYRNDARYLLGQIDAVWGGFLRGQFVLMLIIALLSTIGGLAVGLPGALAVGILAGILDVIPSLGPTLAAVLGIGIALFEGSTYLPVANWVFAIIVLGVFILVQQIENIWIRPALMGWQLRLHPALVFVGVLGSLAVFGILVTLVIIPVMASVGVILRYINDRINGVAPYPPDVVNLSLEERLEQESFIEPIDASTS